MRNYTTSQGVRKPLTALGENTFKPKTSTGAKHPRNLLSMTEASENLLKIEPQYPCFENIQPQTVYKMLITIQNQGSQTSKVKIVPPSTKYFRLVHDSPSFSLASGLMLKVVLQFKGNEINDYQDSFSLVSQNFTQTIPISAKSPIPNILYDSEINLGYIPIQQTTSFDLPFQNTGVTGNIILNCQNKNVSIVPQVFDLNKDDKRSVNIKIKPKSQNQQTNLIQVLVNNKILKTISVNYNAMQQQQLVLENGHQLHRLDFGKIFYGKKKSFKLKIFNNTNHKTEYNVSFKRASNAKRMSMKLETVIEDKLFDIIPNNKQLAPFESIDVELTLYPPIHQYHLDKVSKNAKRMITESGSQLANKMLSKFKMVDDDLEYSMIVKFTESNYLASLYCTLSLPNIKLSATEFYFGDIKFNDRMEKTLTIQNLGELTTEIQFDKIPFVQIQPKKLTLQGRDVKIFKISVVGSTLGKLQKTQKITIAKSYDITIDISANIVGQILQLPKTASKMSRNFSTLFRNTTRQNFGKMKNFSQVHKNTDVVMSSTNIPSVFNPKLTLPDSKQGLFVIRPIDKYLPLKKSTKSVMVCKDRGKRTQVHNHRQLSQIQMQLSKQSLKQIQCNLPEIDFGVMFLKSKQTKRLHIINGLLTSIQIRLQLSDTKYVQFSHPRTIVSPQQKGSFDITFKAIELGDIKTNLKYIINEKHSFQLLVFARIIPVNLQLDKQIVKLSYSPNTRMDIEQSLILKNPGNSSSEFSIANTVYCKFTPNQGVLKSKQQQQIKLNFKPLQTEVLQPGERQYKSKEQTNSYDEMALIKITDGIDIPLKIMCQVPQSRCFIKENEINFEKVLINQVKMKTFTIKNASKITTAVYEIDLKQLEYCCTVDYVKGKIAPEGTKDIHVTFKIDKQVEVNQKLSVNFRGGTTIQLPILATTVVPYIDIQQPVLNFGTITIMSNNIIPITVENKSEFYVDLMIDLTEQIVKDCLAIENEDVWIEDEVLEFCLKPDQKRTFRIRFQSTKVKYYSFEFPLYLPGKIKTKSMVRNIQCNVQKTRLMIQPTQIKFQKAIISDQIVPMLEVFRIHNTQNRSIRWKLQEVNPTVKSFKPEPQCGWLNSDQSTDVIMKFVPKKQGQILAKFVLRILDQTNSTYSNQLEIKVQGKAAYPKLIFDKRELIMPVVPLNIQSRASFKIINDGYTNMELTYKLDVDQSLKSTINVSFPEGKKLISNKVQLPVYLTFISKAPISFSARLQIFDSLGKCYTIILSGTSQNSLLTCYPYLQQKLFYYTIYKKSVHQLMIEQFAEPEPLSKLNQFFLPQQSSYRNVNAALLRWLKLTLSDEKLQKFPGSLIESKGQPIFRLINLITNQRDVIRCTSKSTLQNYNNLLKYLKSHGCLLNHIRGYYLLSKQQYLAQLQSDIHIEIPKLHMQYTYWYKSYEAWIVLMFQIITVFKLDFFNNKTKTKQIEDRYSNIYSTLQLSWIKWIQTSLPQSQRQAVSITRLKDCFSDGFVLGNLLFQYLPHKAILTKNLKAPPCKIQDIKHNFKEIKEMLKVLNLFFFDGFNIQQFGDKQYIMFIRYLYNFLPGYVPKSQALFFCCQVNEQITKTIDITNSSNKPISYLVKIIGNQDFSATESIIKIDAKKTYKLSVKYRCSLWRESRAYLMLTSRKQGLSLSAPCVFELVNQIIKKTRTKKLEPVSCTLYQSMMVRIDLDKLTATRQVTQYVITLKQEDENQNIVNGKYKAFSCDLDRVRIIKDVHSYIEILYAPKSMKSSKCYISFNFEDKQTYTFQMIGTPQMPKAVIFKPPHVLYVRKPQVIEISIPQPSPLALKQLSELNQLKQQSVLSIKSNLSHELMNYISIPHQINTRQKLKINIKSQHSIKDLALDILFTNDSLTDIRRVKAIINIIPEMVIVQQMKTTAGISVVKQIYISNPTDKDWRIQTRINHSQFSVTNQRQFVCKKGGDHTIALNFHPQWVMVVKTKLEILNMTTNQVIEYQLIGVSEQPIAQRTIEFKCKLRQLQTFMINVLSPFDANDYDVQIDLIGCYGLSTCTLNNQKAYYNLTVNPILTGTSTGSLIFYTKDRKYFWYKLVIVTQDAQYQNALNVETTVGVPIQLEIKIQNKSATPDYFSIQLIGDQLYGQPKLQVKPNSTSNYKIIYSPVHQNTNKGQVIFRSIISGQQSYYLDLKAIKATKAKDLSQIQCQVGNKKSFYIPIQNPLPQSTPLTVSVNNKNFALKYPDQIQPNSKQIIQVIYRPTVVQQQQCQIIIHPKKLGRRVYLQKAKAINPMKKILIDFKCQLNSQQQKLIQFKQSNYDHLKVFLSDEDQSFEVKEVFEQNKIMNMLVAFKPQQLKEFSTYLNLTIGGKHAHVYELRGSVEIKIQNQQSVLKLEGKCKTKTIKYLDVMIKQIKNPENDVFTFEIRKLPEHLNNVTVAKLMNSSPLAKDGLLRFQIKTQPQKPFEGECEIHLFRKGGGLWIYKLQVSIQPPEPQGIIQITTKIKTIGAAYLNLSQFPTSQNKYQCNILGADKQFFDVSPSGGALTKDTRIKVDFQPTKLLKSNYTAILDIVTDNYLRRYQLKGSVPVYHPPKKVKRIQMQ